MKQINLFLAIIAISIFNFQFGTLNCNAQTSVPGGIVNGTWTLAGSPYNTQGSIQIVNGDSLTIEPGVTVNFQGNNKFLILGKLKAIGTVTDSITFTAANPTNGWRGIRFENTLSSNDTSRITYCKVQYGSADLNGGGIYFSNFSKAVIFHSSISNCSATGDGGGIYCNNSNPIIMYNTISNNTISSGFNGAGIYCYGSSPTISNNTISNNTGDINHTNGGGIYCSESNPIISGNTLFNNYASDWGGGICINYSSNPIVTKNIIYNNTTQFNGGGIVCANGSNPNICNNTISNNTALDVGGGIYCNNSSPNISNNSITNNSASSYGGGIACYYGNPAISNNTIAFNSSANGGALTCEGADPTLRNTIFWGNTTSAYGTQVFLTDEASDPDFYYCDVQGGSTAFELNGNFYIGTYQNNVDTNPLFVSPSGGSGTGFNGVTANWSLQSNSPCIDSGDPNGTYPPNDILGNNRVAGNNIDIGAYEYGSLSGISNYDIRNQMIIYPNPFNESATIKYNSAILNVELCIYNLFGKKVKTITNISGDNTKIERDNLPSGIYFIYVTQNNKIITTEKIIIID